MGERYERQDIYLSGLIMAGEIFRGVMEIVQPDWENSTRGGASGRVLLGTVAPTSTTSVRTWLRWRSGLSVSASRTSACDVPPQAFLEATRRTQARHSRALGLLTLAFDSMRDTIALIRQDAAELGRMPLFVIGGATIDEHIARYTDTDHWTNDAMEGIRYLPRWNQTDLRRGSE